MPPPTVLKEAETVKFSLPAPTLSLPEEYCDGDGNIYLRYTDVKPRSGFGPMVPPSFEGRPITKLSIDSQSGTRFATPSLSGYVSLELLNFTVDSFEDVYGLYEARPSAVNADAAPMLADFIIVKFDDGGSVSSVVKLQNPPTGVLSPSHFVVFPDGNLLVAGIVGPTPPPPNQEAGSMHVPRVIMVHHTPSGVRPFTGIFDSQGRFERELRLPGDVSPKRAASASGSEKTTTAGSGPASTPQGAKSASPRSPWEGPPGTGWTTAVMGSLAVAGPENTAYLLRASNPLQLYTLSSDGQVLYHAHIDYRGRNVMPTNMSLAGQSRLLITLYSAETDKKSGNRLMQVFALADPDTGKIDATYRLPTGARVMPACAAGRNDFLFIGSTKGGELKVVHYSPR